MCRVCVSVSECVVDPLPSLQGESTKFRKRGLNKQFSVDTIGAGTHQSKRQRVEEEVIVDLR